MASGTVEPMRNLFALAVAVAFFFTACASQSPSPKPDPVSVASASATLACTVVAAEKPQVIPQLVDALDKTIAVVGSPDPTAAAIVAGLAEIKDPQSKVYVAGVVNLALVLFPATASGATLPPVYVDALTAALTSCRNVVVPTTTTSTSTLTTSTTL